MRLAAVSLLLSYMEVAVMSAHSRVNSFIRSSTFATVQSCLATTCVVILAGSAFLTLAGCGDAVTFSQDAQRTGLQQYDDGDYADAAGSFQNAVRQDPTDYKAHYYLAASYEQTGKVHLAIAHYEQALGLMAKTLPGRNDVQLHDQIVNNLVDLLAKSDDTQSETDLLLTQAKNDQSAEDYQIAARVFRKRGDADTALQCYNKAVLAEPGNFSAAKEYGLYLVQLNQNDQAAAQLRTAYRQNQDDPQVNAALQQIGITPGPGLLAENQLAQPLIPRGPLPSLGATTPNATPNATPIAGTDAAAPKD
jgi:Tfp pilus assembly protein PilF